MKKIYSFARAIKSRIPENMDQKYLEHQQQLKQQTSKLIYQARDIQQLIEIYDNMQQHIDVSNDILKRLAKLNLKQEVLQEQQNYIQEWANQHPNLGLYFMERYQLEAVDKLLLELFRQDKVKANLKILEIVKNYGGKDDIIKWENQQEFEINGSQIQKFYHLIDNLDLSNKILTIGKYEQTLHKYIHQYDYQTIFLILKNRTFNSKVINTELINSIITRLQQLDISIQQLVDINQIIMVELEYCIPQWLKFISQQVYKFIKPIQQQEIINEEDDDYFDKVEIEAKQLGQFELQLVQLMGQLSSIFITQELHYLIMQLFSVIETHMMSFMDQLNADQQLLCYKFHSRLIETYFNESKKDTKTYAINCSKKLEMMNNQYYETTLKYLKELNFEQSTILLEAASVLGISKRKVCQKLFNIGLDGLYKAKLSKLSDDQKNYLLLAHTKLLKLFLTRKHDLVLIDKAFQDINTSLLKLEMDYGYIPFSRKQISQII